MNIGTTHHKTSTKNPYGYIILGDIHGRLTMLKSFHELAKRTQMTLVCVGDYTDSFLQTVDKQVQTLTYLRDNPDIICVIGNHDAQYMTPKLNRSWQVTGYSRNKYSKFKPLYRDIKLNWYFAVDDLLVTHAGLTNKLVERFDFNHIDEVTSYLDSYVNEANVYLANGWSPQESIPPLDKHMGILWCRPYDYVPIKGITQVFGHTSTEKLKFFDNGNPDAPDVCVDVLFDKAEAYVHRDGKGYIMINEYAEEMTELFKMNEKNLWNRSFDRIVQRGHTVDW